VVGNSQTKLKEAKQYLGAGWQYQKREEASMFK